MEGVLCLCRELGDVARGLLPQLCPPNYQCCWDLLHACDWPPPAAATHTPTHAVSLSNACPLGHWSAGIILHFLSGGERAGRTRSLPREKV